MRDVVTRSTGVAWMTRAEIAGTSACGLTFAAWNFAASQNASLNTLRFFVLACLACLLAGRSLLAEILKVDARDFPTVFLCGFLALNTALYVLAWISPLPIVTNALLLFIAVLIFDLHSYIRKRIRHTRSGATDGTSSRAPGSAALGLFALGISLAASTLWSQDAIMPMAVNRAGVHFIPWIDGFYHTCGIRMFRDGRGLRTLGDVRMSGRPVMVYHYASYLAPALVSEATNTPAYLAFTSFQIPSGVLLTGLAAYALARSLSGRGEAGVAALVPLLLLPDPSHYAFRNPFLSYHWLQQVAPAGLSGVAVFAVAWMLMFEGCRTGRSRLVLAGFVTAGFGGHYKAHLFVANALILWLYPGVFFKGIRPIWRLAWVGFALASFVAVVSFANRSESVPTLRLDGSGIKEYLDVVVKNCSYHATRARFSGITPSSPLMSDVSLGAILIGYGTLGLAGVANILLALVAAGRRLLGRRIRASFESIIFPLLMICNYLVMSLGLALDEHKPLHRMELLHRPLVWAYFVSAVWAGLLSYRLLLEPHIDCSARLRKALLAGILLLLAVPWRQGAGVQVGPDWGRQFTNRSFARSWLEGARFIRETASPGDVVQTSDNDPILAFSAICEQPAYVSDYLVGKPDQVVSRRIAELNRFKAMTAETDIRRRADQLRIRWFLLLHKSDVNWPQSLLAQPAFSWGGVNIYEFTHDDKPK